MKRQSTVIRYLLSFALLAFWGTQGLAQPVGVQLQEAYFEELTVGNLNKAVELYQVILKDRGATRSQLAQARFRLGLALLKLGKPLEASTALRQVMRLFPEEEAVFNEAERLLAGLPEGGVSPTKQSSAGATYTLVKETTDVGHSSSFSFDVSPDGESLAYLGPWPADKAGARSGGPGARNSTSNVTLYLTDRRQSSVRPLLNDWGPGSAGVPEPGQPGAKAGLKLVGWSPDGASIAFVVSEVADSYEGDLSTVPRSRFVQEKRKAYRSQVYVVSARGGSPRKLGNPLGIRDRRLWIGWTPDSKGLAYLRIRDYAVVLLGLDGKERVTAILSLPKALNFRQISLGTYSPDGGWIALTTPASKTEPTRDLWVFSSDGKDKTQLNKKPLVSPVPRGRNADAPGWSPDGKWLYYHDQGNIWKLRFEGAEKSTEDPRQVTFFDDAFAIQTRVARQAGTLAFSLVKVQTKLAVGSARRPEAASILTRGTNGEISPDGQTIYFLGEGPGQEGIYSMSKTGEQRRRLLDAAIAGPRWGKALHLSPDGSQLAFISGDAGRRGLFLLPSQGGEAKRLADIGAAAPSEIAWSPDGTRLAYLVGKDLMTIPVKGGDPTKLGALQEWHYGAVRWSSDGSLLAALGCQGDCDDLDVFLFEAANPGQPRVLTKEFDAWLDCVPAWRPGENRLTFFSYEDNRNWEVDLEGQISGPLFSHDGSWEYCGSWAPDGKRFFFTGSTESVWRVFYFDAAEDTIENFPNLTSGISQTVPVFSSDGETVLWQETTFQRQLWLADQRD
ncbi:MAG TPA: hypothetical protein VLU25_17760 [Acidobacteriota bacterium]|nr:hypothetical protein [Acidobacteriota bacterium]